MTWWGILSIQDDQPPACLGAGGEPSPHQVPCKQASAPVNEEQMGHYFFICHESGSEGKEWRAFGLCWKTGLRPFCLFCFYFYFFY